MENEREKAAAAEADRIRPPDVHKGYADNAGAIDHTELRDRDGKVGSVDAAGYFYGSIGHKLKEQRMYHQRQAERIRQLVRNLPRAVLDQQNDGLF